MTLEKLLDGVEVVEIIGKKDVEIADVNVDSNSVNKESAFICLEGSNFDGHDFAKKAELYGATVIVSQKQLNVCVTQVIVKSTRKALSLMVRNFYDKPDLSLKICGVTGTNGKTTTCHLVGKILNGYGINCGVIGTLGTFYNGKRLDTVLTTPDPLILYKTLREMVDDGVEVVVMEVSAHAVFYDKIYGMQFEIGVFTNFSQDHLDFFECMDNYKNAKIDFFKKNKINYCLLNSDDEVGREISKIVKKPVLYGIENPADVFAIDLELSAYKSRFIINVFDFVYQLAINLKGVFNVYNSLAAVSSACILGVPVEKAVNELAKISGVEGRLETVYQKDFSVLIDYAHTPDGIEKCLQTVKSFTKNRLISVFGCGGNRDSDKREKMGEISAKIADFTIVTSDNPRYEEPMEIIWQIEKGVLKHTKNYVLVEEREQAIKYALNIAKKGDVVVVLGKGSEKYMEVFGIKRPYNDKDTIENILRGES